MMQDPTFVAVMRAAHVERLTATPRRSPRPAPPVPRRTVPAARTTPIAEAPVDREPVGAARG